MLELLELMQLQADAEAMETDQAIMEQQQELEELEYVDSDDY